MKHIFYILTIFPILWEFICITDIKRFWDNRCKMVELKKQKANFDLYSTNQKALTICMIGYFIWNFVGLLTFQWPVFLALLLLGFIPKPWIWLEWIDGFISIFVLLFIVLNAYHCKIDIYLLLKSLI
jgi:hypothetical protein